MQNATSETRSRLAQHPLTVRRLIIARTNNDMILENKLIESLKEDNENVDQTLKILGHDVDFANIDKTREPALNIKVNNFAEIWLKIKDAEKDVVSSRIVSKHLKFVEDSSYELNNKLSLISEYLQNSNSRQLKKLAGLNRTFTIICVIYAILLALWIYYRLLRALHFITDRIKLMANDKMTIDSDIPSKPTGEFWELHIYFNKLLDRFRDADHMKNRFLATMSHEIRTPMNGVIGFIQNLKETDLNPQQQQYLRIIDSSARALLHVINEILDFSKLQSGKMDLEIVAFDLKALLRERVAIMRHILRNKPVTAKLNVPDEELIIHGDPTRLRQVIENLLNNAIKFTESGSIELSLQVQKGPDDNISLNFSVDDTGVGIRPEQKERLFEAFTQAENSTTRKHGGTGLGLSIAANLISLMGGKIQVESIANRGSKFFFTIKTTTAPAQEKVQLSEHYNVTIPSKVLKKYWALLVDDTPTNLFLMETICQSIGLPYMTATNGLEAVEKARNSHFDLIFMDIQMPVMDGYTAIREIRKFEDAATTQIIALTASAFQEDIVQALGAGSTGFIAKPFEKNQLLLCIAEHLGIPTECELRPKFDDTEEHEAIIIRKMYDYMRRQYQISLGEIKMILAQTVNDWRPVLDDIVVFSEKGDWDQIRPAMHRFKGQLSSIGLLDFSEEANQINEDIHAGNTSELAEQISNFSKALGLIFRRLETEITMEHGIIADN